MNNGFYEFSRGKQETATTSSVFPYTGSALITGSLGVTGSLANGLDTIASGIYSHAEGRDTQATSRYSHAEGSRTTASADYSHAEGLLTVTSGEYSHAEGVGTITAARYQHAQGQYNISSLVNSAFIIGNGSDPNNRSNLVFAADNTFQVTGSLNVSGSITGSLFGTASFATSASRAVTSSFAISASWAPSQTVDTSSLVTTSSFNSFTSSYNTGSFTGSFRGDGSGLTNLPGQSVNTSSLATTGSNTFIGNQVITGSVNVSGSTTQIGTNNLLGQTNLSGSIIVSGTMQANANVTIGGTLRLDPAQDPGSTNATASFLFTSASNTAQGYDLYYRQSDNIVKFKWIEGGISTGLLYGGVVSASGTTIYVSSGSGIIMTANASLSQEISPTFKYVSWGNYSAPATYLTTSQNTFIYVDDTGVVRQQPNYFAETQYQEAICLGRATHANYTTITGVGSNVQTTYDSDAQQNDFIRAFGPLKTSGLTVTGQTNTLRLNIGAGQSYNLGGFYPQNPDHPSDYTSNAFLTASIARAYRSGSGIYLDNNGGAFFTVVDPTKYDNGSGVLQNTGTGNWTIQRVFVNPVSGRVVVYYGQTRYTTQINALQYLNTDLFTEGEFTAKSLIFAGYLVLKGNTTDLTDSENTIIQSGIFRNTAGGSASTGTVSLALDNLSDVNITTPTDGQALIYNSGTWQNGTPISASHALTASYLEGSISPFPFTGSAQITGSLNVTGSITATSLTGSLFGTASWARNNAGTFGASFDGMGSVVLVNTRTFFTAPRAGIITAWSIIADGTFPTCSLDIWRTGSLSATLPTGSNSIVGGTYPAISGSAVNYVRSTNLSTWTSSFAANDIFAINIVSCSVATKVNLQLEIIYTS
jgi:hypothetical protein